MSSTKNRITLFHGEKDETPQRLPFAGVHDFDFSVLLGSGGFGAVFKAHRRSTGVDYALKVQPIEALARSTRSIARRETDETLVHMERTVLACCRDHPFIVNLEYAFYTDKHAILALEYVPGEFQIVYVNKIQRLSKANVTDSSFKVVHCQILYLTAHQEDCLFLYANCILRNWLQL